MPHLQCAGVSKRHYVMNRDGGNRSHKHGVFKSFFDNMKEGLEKNKEMQVYIN